MGWTTRHHQLVGHPDNAARVTRDDHQTERCPTCQSERGLREDGQLQRRQIGRLLILTMSQSRSAGLLRAMHGLRRANGTATSIRQQMQSKRRQLGDNRLRHGSRGLRPHENPRSGPARVPARLPRPALPHEEGEIPGSLPERRLPRVKVLNGQKLMIHSPPTTICLNPQ